MAQDLLSAFVQARTKPQAPLTQHLNRPPRRSARRRRARTIRGRWAEVLATFGTTGRMGRVRRTEYGREVEVAIDGRHAAQTLTQSRETVAGIFRVAEIDATPHPGDVSRATLRLVRRDLLERWAGRPWPGLDAQRLSLWEPIELGWTRFGEDVRLELTDRPHVLLAGQTRSGKSVCQSMFVATGALSGAELYLFDPQTYQLGRWAPVAKEFVTNDMGHAKRVLDGLLEELDRRGAMIPGGLDKLDRQLAERLGLPMLLVVVDEGAEYLAIKDFTARITRLCARGAGLGLRVVFGTQSPNATIIPTPLRGNMQRLAFRVADGPASRVALDTASVDASQIPLTQPGVCYVERDGAGLSRMRTYYLTPAQVHALVARAVSSRRSEVGSS